jgi:hypothetical protein
VGAALVENTGSLDGSLDISINAPSDSNNTTFGDVQDTANRRVFESTHAWSNTKDISFPLQDLGLEAAKLTIDISSDPYVFEVDLPKPLDSTNVTDAVTLSFDADNDGVEDFQAKRDGDGSNTYTESTGYPVSRNQTSFPAGWNITDTGDTVTFEIPASEFSSDPFAIGAQVRYPTENPQDLSYYGSDSADTDTNVVVPLTPGFQVFNSPASVLTSPFDGTASRYVEIESSSLRSPSDLVEIDLYLDGDYAAAGGDNDLTDGDEDLTAVGKVGRLQGGYDLNWPLPTGEKDYLVVEWEVPINTGNPVAGESTEFDITLELNQRGSQ